MFQSLTITQPLLTTVLVLTISLDVRGQFATPDEASVRGVTIETAPNADEELVIFRLRHTSAKSVRAALEEMSIGNRITVDVSSNTLIVNVSKDEAGLLSRLIEQLDRNTPGRESDDTRFVRVTKRGADQVADLIREVISRGRLRVAVDGTNNLLILSGQTEAIQAAADLVERVDQAQSSMNVQFFFVQGIVGGDSRGEVNLPAALKGVGEALVANGFGHVSLLAPLSTQVQEGSEFSNEGFTGGLATGYAISVRGSVQKGTVPGTCRLNVQAEVMHAESELTVFSVETTLVARFGDYVILAAAPSSHNGSDTLALVVRVDETSPSRRAR